jgi:type IV pilus assembly protein PilW
MKRKIVNKLIASRRSQRGLSIIEVMVSLVIGMVVVAAVLFSYLGSGITGRSQSALAQMNEDATAAFSIMARDIQMAGFSEPSGVVASAPGGTATFGRVFTGSAIFGCEPPIANAAATGNMTCSTAAGASTATHSIEVSYQATPVNSIPNATGTPTDCLGNALSISGTYYVSTNRYYVDSTTSTLPTELYCSSRGNSGQPLVENVQAMKLWFGEAVAADPRRAVRYVRASDVVDWGLVVSVRMCLLMRSVDPVLDPDDPVAANYTNCEGATVASTDRRLYQAFFSTVALRNRMGL